ncbi:BamA/TamA family outer membrane protein [Ramlibacter sp. H39-3-26]|uniref:autotransporter assembly complex protein TamA n=1 Tax=Curvibacter soli TaxID=3031331 RepID=UPI0023DA5E9D|nr:BamA/TamA family outer membrane protein [Ramlibacter sp. H39-3-26]MDF1484850.1 BamA/TamA family outer membrane protein [Ramlibacter sp. H39-3-26]
MLRTRAGLFLALAGALLLPGCSLLPRQGADDAAQRRAVPAVVAALPDADASGTPPAAQRPAFTLEVNAPDAVRDYLARHLDLQRYRMLGDLSDAEVARLLGAAEGNARDLLGTLGYFAPTLTLELRDTPGGGAPAPRAVTITVEPGPRTHIAEAHVGFAGPIAADGDAAAQRAGIENGWGLKPGQPFTQSAWDDAKAAGLRALTARRYPAGRLAGSQAAIDADAATARLDVQYDSGPLYRLGGVQVRGSERYDPVIAERLARLQRGAAYDQATLLEAQARLAASGYYDSVFLMLDTEAPDPLAAPVIAQVRDAKLQKAVFGVGASTDSGPRLSLDHTHNQLPLIGWRAVSRISLDRKTRLASTAWDAPPEENGWHWLTSALVQRETTGSYDVSSGRLRGGRGKSGDHIDRTYYLQYDYASNQGAESSSPSAAVSVNYGWTGRYFDSALEPTRGMGLALSLGLGSTLHAPREPYTRTYARWLGYQPLGSAEAAGGEARRSRLALRLEGGAVVARSAAPVPSTEMFLTGGDTTVRGYGYNQIGARVDGDRTFAGRYLAVGSVEWQRPIVRNGEATAFESTVFVDAGAVANKPRDLQAKVGVGAGVRWRSPVGPMQADLAYGVDARRLRLHLRVGFAF